MGKTTIEWATDTWNPTTGCSKVSAGCAHCYAERVAERFWKDRAFSEVQCHPDRLEQPLHWRKPRRVFVDSMSDLFHEDIPAEFISSVFEVMEKCPQHTFMILTKRPERMLALLKIWSQAIEYIRPLPNVWLGVSVEDQKAADERIPLLLKTPAALLFVSCEPLLGPVDLLDINGALLSWWKACGVEGVDAGDISWVIAGGESGPEARLMHPDWARSLRDQCQSSGVPFFLKQIHVNGKLVKMPKLDGKIWNEVPYV